ncbi:MAG: hypothetical protein MJ238_06490 [Bacilli bacterium]|nr:hypothetical protein [Bacilli bacterium]
MARKLYTEESVRKIAVALRNTNGSKQKYKISEMGSAIDSWAPIRVLLQYSNQDDPDEIDLTGFNPKNLVTMANMFTNTGFYNKIKPMDLAYLFNDLNKSISTWGMFALARIDALYSSFDKPLKLPNVEQAAHMFEYSEIDRIDQSIKFEKLIDANSMFKGISHNMIVGEKPDTELNTWGLINVNMMEMFYTAKHLESIHFGTDRTKGIIAPSNADAMFAGAEFHSQEPLDLRAFDFSSTTILNYFMNSTIIDSHKILFPEEAQFMLPSVRIDHMFKDIGVTDYSGLKFIKIDRLDNAGYISYIIADWNADITIVDLRNIAFSRVIDRVTGKPIYNKNDRHLLFIVGTDADRDAINDKFKDDDGSNYYKNIKTVEEYEGG